MGTSGNRFGALSGGGGEGGGFGGTFILLDIACATQLTGARPHRTPGSTSAKVSQRLLYFRLLGYLRITATASMRMISKPT